MQTSHHPSAEAQNANAEVRGATQEKRTKQETFAFAIDICNAKTHHSIRGFLLEQKTSLEQSPAPTHKHIPRDLLLLDTGLLPTHDFLLLLLGEAPLEALIA